MYVCMCVCMFLCLIEFKRMFECGLVYVYVAMFGLYMCVHLHVCEFTVQFYV